MHVQKVFVNAEADFLADYSIILGDLNYRLETTFSDVSKAKFDMRGFIDKEQLSKAISDGYYPGYTEPVLNFMPSYKLALNDQGYTNKKE